MPSAARSPESGCVASTYRFDASSSSAVAPGMRIITIRLAAGWGSASNQLAPDITPASTFASAPGRNRHIATRNSRRDRQVEKDRPADPHRPAQLDPAERSTRSRSWSQAAPARPPRCLDDQRAANDPALEIRRPGIGIAGIDADEMAIRAADRRFGASAALVPAVSTMMPARAARESRLTLW